jgi:integrase
MGKGWLPKANKRKDNVLTPEQVRALAEELPERYRIIIYFAAYTGLRAGEIAALRRGTHELSGPRHKPGFRFSRARS